MSIIKYFTKSDDINQYLTELKRNFNMAWPLPIKTENSDVTVEMRRLMFALRTIHNESPTSISIPKLLLAHANKPVNVTE